ncbi:unnamed protein product [Fraxinus pennsylvanica]|uniref:Uncharacterized protein n=1 Tax=Fraxinus pennsylvanica TaxID=56036 RepID=A0AAD1Z9Z8_9LAMI|nr:unnamed protein product [Fraxinus pennsylvanica]
MISINGKPAITGLDLTTVAGGLTAAYYMDFVMNSSMVDNANPMTVQFGPMNENTGARNALLNGLEVFRINNSVSSLDGEYGVDGKSADGPGRGIVAAVGFAIMFGTFVGLGVIAVKWQKGPQDWRQNHSFSSWLLPLHTGDTSSMSNIKTSLGSCKSQFFSSTSKLGLYFYLVELQEATKNWDPNAIIGVSGFVNNTFWRGRVVEVVAPQSTRMLSCGVNELDFTALTKFGTKIKRTRRIAAMVEAKKDGGDRRRLEEDGSLIIFSISSPLSEEEEKLRFCLWKKKTRFIYLSSIV